MGSFAQRLRQQTFFSEEQPAENLTVPTVEGRTFVDPRPDLGDSELWCNLLSDAADINWELYGVLHGFRCHGTVLVKGQNSYMLRPKIGPNEWSSQQEYERERDKWLRKYLNEIKQLLCLENFRHLNQV